MEVQTYKYSGRTYEFAPITFRSFNAKDWGDYKDGMNADVMLNNQNNNYDDDIDNVFPYAFGDWGNVDFNYPLWYALCDLQGVDPTTGKPLENAQSINLKSRRVQTYNNVKLQRNANPMNIIRVPSVEYKKRPGNFGSLIYNDEVIEIPE